MPGRGPKRLHDLEQARRLGEIFVPTPQAYLMAGLMFVLSALAVLWLARQARLRAPGYALCLLAYLGTAFILTRVLAQVFA